VDIIISSWSSYINKPLFVSVIKRLCNNPNYKDSVISNIYFMGDWTRFSVRHITKIRS